MDYKKLLEAAEKEFINAVNVAMLVEDGNLWMPVRGVLRLYAILKNWYKVYEQKAEDGRRAEDADMVQSYECVTDLLSREIERFEDIFRDWEISIRLYFRDLQSEQSVSEQVLQDALIFAEMAEHNEDLFFNDWKSLLPSAE